MSHEFNVMQFTGCGDPAFGGNADDRLLYEVGTASAWCYRFMPGHEARRAAFHGEHVVEARFASQEAAKAAAETAIGRVPGAPLAATVAR